MTPTAVAVFDSLLAALVPDAEVELGVLGSQTDLEQRQSVLAENTQAVAADELP